MQKTRDKIFVPIIIVLSVLIPLVVFILLNLPERYDLLGLELGTYPFFHAVLNGTTAILLVIGYVLIKQNKPNLHKNVMITAFCLSSIFLVSYVLSKISNDPVPYGGEGVLRYIYFFILITHIVLSAIIVPLVLFTMYRGLTKEYIKHKKIAKYTFPIWLYVAITGVLVYVFMVPYY
ncbi:DUF420 domain-containing protein [Mesonia sp. K7]|nr:DUF420 domain-containing protein [Mesonia sp. K7]PZD78805.1 DUF420 domain-containing protein [Mesonia sp. K7]